MSNHAVYEIVERREGWICIRDVGPWTRHLSVTNDVEHVVKMLDEAGRLGRGTRLFYYDTEGELDEIRVVWDAKELVCAYYVARFVGFLTCKCHRHFELSAYVGATMKKQA